MRKNQKGFTLVELLVVIAILAILATVAVVGYTNFIESANESNDKTLVAQLNKLIQLEQIDNTDINLVEAINALEENGVDIDDIINPESKSNKILWDDEKKCFVIVDESDALVYAPNGYALNSEKSVYYAFLTGKDMPTSDYSIYWLLSEDVTAETRINIAKNIVIDGNGHTITSTEIATDTYARAINITGNDIFVGMRNLSVIYDNDNQTYTRGINVAGTGVELYLSHTNVTNEKYYAINVVGVAKDFNITVCDNSVVSGYAALNIFGKNGNIDVDNSTLNGTNTNDDSEEYPGTNDFATILFGNDGENYASDVNITVTNSKISAEARSTAKQFYTSFHKNDENCSIILNNCNLLTENADLYERNKSYHPDAVHSKLIIDGVIK